MQSTWEWMPTAFTRIGLFFFLRATVPVGHALIVRDWFAYTQRITMRHMVNGKLRGLEVGVISRFLWLPMRFPDSQ